MLNQQGLTEEEFLEQYNANHYERPSVTVDMLIFTIGSQQKENYRKLSKKTLQLLLIKRGEHPYMNQWALPGGFVSINESIDDAAIRELKEETNVDNIYMEQLYTWGDVGRDPRTRVISCSYMALVNREKIELHASTNATDAKWFDMSYTITEEKVNEDKKEKLVQLQLTSGTEHLSAIIKITELPNKTIREIISSEDIAFDHAKMIFYAVERLQNKIEYTDVAFQLMPPQFTLTELQQVYEIILNKQLLSAAFRRKIAHLVTETNEYTKNAGHRPSQLFRFNKQ